MKKRYLLILSLLFILLSVSCVSAGFFDWFGGGNDDSNSSNISDASNITYLSIRNESTMVQCNINEIGEIYSAYVLEGAFNCSSNIKSGYYLFKTAIYDEYGKFIKNEETYYSSGSILFSSKTPSPLILDSIDIKGFKNVSVYEVKIYTPNNELIFEKNISFDMDNVITHHIRSYDDSSSNSDSLDTDYSTNKFSSSEYGSYVGNTNTGKFHIASCSSVSKMSESNKIFFSTREEAINQGYVPCQRCNP